MTSFRKIGVALTCAAVFCGAAIAWQVLKEKRIQRKFAEDAQASLVRAQQGNAEGQYALGYSYEQGRGVPLDYAEAVRWFRKAALQGHPWGQVKVGEF